MYEDKPNPHPLYIGFFVALFSFVAIVSILALVLDREASLTILPVLIIAVVALLVMVGFLAYCAVTTSYRLQNGVLYARSGIFKGSFNLGEISDVQLVGFIWRPLGYGLGTVGYCNRFSNGLLLTTGQKKIYISPSNPAEFQQRLLGWRNPPGYPSF